MAKRRFSQTSVTVWLDPAEVEILDRVREDQSRSGYATDLVRQVIAKAAMTRPRPPQNGGPAGRRTGIEILQDIRHPTNGDHGRPDKRIAPRFGPRSGTDGEPEPSPGPMAPTGRGPVDARILESAILRVRSRQYTGPSRPTLSVRQLAEAVQLRRAGHAPRALADRFGCSDRAVDVAIEEVETELRNWSA